MSLLSAVNIAAFGAGALLGAGAVAVVQRRPNAGPSSALPAPAAPVIDVDQKNKPQISSSLLIPQITSGVLKYGNPGMFDGTSPREPLK